MAIGKLCSDSEAPCPIFLDLDSASDRNLAWIKSKLEDSSNTKKVTALEHTILHLLNGEDVSSLLMSIIRFVLPSNHHGLKKLVHLFLQIFDFCTPDGNVREESILVCNALLNDLRSPNEYVRGSTLRLVSKLRHWNIVHPLITAVVDNLRHAEPYVHRNALMCLAKIAERFGAESVMSGMEDTENLLLSDSGISVKIHAFNLLCVCQPSLAVQYLMNIEGTLLNLAPRLHLEILSSFSTLCSLSTEVRSFMMRLTVMLIENSQDNAVRFEGASIICQLKSTPLEARRAAASALIKVLLDESDLNVKMLALNKLNILHARSSSAGDAPNVLEAHVMDIVHALNGASRQVALGLLSLALRSLTRQNVESLLQSFKKAFTSAEDIATYSQQQIAEYRIMLIKAIHYTCGRYPERSAIVYEMLLGYLSHHHQQTAEDCALFFKQLTELLPNLREETIYKLLTYLEMIPHPNVLAVCFWVIGEYAEGPHLASHCCNQIYDSLSPFPFITESMKSNLEDPSSTSDELSQDFDNITTHTVVLQDGTYGAQLTAEQSRVPLSNTLRDMVLKSCDPLFYCSIAQCLLKLSFASGDPDCIAKSCLITVNLVRLMQDPRYADIYSQRRLRTILKLCLGLLKDPDQFKPLLQEYISASRKKWSSATATAHVELKDELDAPISFVTILGNAVEDEWALDDDTDDGDLNSIEDYEIDTLLNTAASIHVVGLKESCKRDTINIHQFTSLMDPLYVEATVSVIATRMYLSLYLKNTTDVLLQNIRVELCANDRLEISSNPPIIPLEPGADTVIHLNFKVKRSQNDVLYGHVYFDKEKSGIQECHPFNPMNVCLYDYVQPSFISSALFRSYWADFEWEHKIQIHPVSISPLELLRGILQVTHMTVVGPMPPSGLKSAPGPAGQKEFLSQYMEYLVCQPELAGVLSDASFFALNLFCKTPHDEEALANLSIVKQHDGLYAGCFKIRSRTQWLFLSRVPGFLPGSGPRPSVVRHCSQLSQNCYYSSNKHGTRTARSRSGLAFGELYRPTSAFERAIQNQIVDRVPYDMVEDWQERIDHIFRDRLSHMPEQFAEISHRYSTDPRDYLITSLLRHCVGKRPRNGHYDLERTRFMETIAETTSDHLGTFMASECGIILRCFSKLDYRNYILQRALIERILHRGQLFSPYATISALNSIADGIAMSPQSQWRVNEQDTNRLLRRLFAQLRSNLDKFNLASLARLTNSLSRLQHDVNGVLLAIKDRLLQECASGTNPSAWTEEVVHFFANGLSRKGILDRQLFDLLRDKIVESCGAYSVDTLVSLSNAYSKFGSAEDAGYIQLFSSLADEIVTQRRQLTNRHVCVVANAFAMSCICHEDLLHVLDETFVFGIDAYDGRQIAMMIHAFNKLGYRSKNHQFIWKKCTDHLDSYNWQGLSMVFHAYTKGELRDDATTNKFCQRLEHLFDELQKLDPKDTPSADLPQPTTYVSLVYSLVKGSILGCNGLLRHLAKGCLSHLDGYEPDEIANLTLAFSKIYNSARSDHDKKDVALAELSYKVLLRIIQRLGDPTLRFSAFSMAKVIDAFGSCAFTPSAHVVLCLIKRNLLTLDRLSYTHITGIIRALSTIGVHDEDVLAVLNSLKHNKRVHHTQVPSPINA
ncbi:coatomer subunit beta-1-like [Babesia ovis]|uniref:Coatomer subunit beta-1-like n=1 Tax=Babesia ovis TaxID=5869 RepID=A0A9W5TAQ0_BABOV|nr:coatomer subunit beta-1-like [Babesia ovis]